ncbi:MAG: large subunit ribosomal protein L23 [Chloroflexi bacterium]|nr:MAG: large subunit ribosomal protein L23 [Chloroflexota bacterium]MBA4374639.1 50S ribosomal protein L23 [Anaerolinea sp.]
MSSIYEVLRRPIVTEKSNYMVNKLHQYVFEVAKDANRTMVKDAVEKIFEVKVVRVNIINVPAKRGRKGRSRRLTVTSAEYKKAVITLIPEDRIPIFEGVE